MASSFLMQFGRFSLLLLYFSLLAQVTDKSARSSHLAHWNIVKPLKGSVLTRQADAQENGKESEEQGSKEDIPQIAISHKFASILCSNSDSAWLLLSIHIRGEHCCCHMLILGCHCYLVLFVRGRAQGAEPEAWWRWGNPPQTWYTKKMAELHLGWRTKVSFAWLVRLCTDNFALQRPACTLRSSD